VDIENLLVLDPDVVLDGAAEPHADPSASRVLALRDAPGWRDLRAQKQGKVRPLSASAVLRPGPRIGEGLIALARALHGDAAVP
jgi:iron complex transport system substrate-binding protein